ncbi:MAG TPA: VOC family protein [Enhygromyxa sp.]|nr:VOC family protein [Enhygromyxa sp.]
MQRVVLLFSLCLACNGAPSKTKPPEARPGNGGHAVEPIPAGFRAVTPVLTVSDVAAALEWYGNAFAAKPMLSLANAEGTVLHAELELGDGRLMLDAEDPEHGHLAPASLGGVNVGFYLYVENVDAAYEKAVNLGAESDMPPTDMLWGDRVAELTDPAGHHWSLATHVQDISPEQIAGGYEALAEAIAAGEDPPAITLERTATSWKPEGYPTLIPTIIIEGGVAALSFYEDAFAAKVLEEVPMPDGKTLLHGNIRIGDSLLMLQSSFDAKPELQSAVELGGTVASFYNYVESVDDSWQRAVDAGATAVMKPTEMFWGDRVGELLDRSGVPWMIATHVRDVPPEELAERFAQAVAQ